MSSNENSFSSRHLGPDDQQSHAMLAALGVPSLDDLMRQCVPDSIRSDRPLELPAEISEWAALNKMKALAESNEPWRSLIGQGYYGTATPPVIKRNILENPGWYTQYTPYQSEISQGRLEALINFQTMVSDLCRLPVANASLLDEATAAAEAIAMCWAKRTKNSSNVCVVSPRCHPQTIAVIKTRAAPIGIELAIDEPPVSGADNQPFAALLQYPATDGSVHDDADLIAQLKARGTRVIVATDLLALMLLKSPGDLGAEIAVGSAQRFGVPMGFGGPHAAFIACSEEFTRKIPGRIIGISRDRSGAPAYRMALQTREQHIRRDKATSNICTSQVLLAIMAAMYAVYHGPAGLKAIATRVHRLTCRAAAGLRTKGLTVSSDPFFDTILVEVSSDQRHAVLQRLTEARINVRRVSESTCGLSFDELSTVEEVDQLIEIFAGEKVSVSPEEIVSPIPASWLRSDEVLQHPVFHRYRSETAMMRYLRSLESKDLSLVSSMIPLGSCTMKLNAASELMPISWDGFSSPHPFVPLEQVRGYLELTKELEHQLAACTGFDAVSLQPNSGAQGEYTGLLVIREYLRKKGEGHRNICLIPASAHGTNPASAVMAGLKVVPVECDSDGNINLQDLTDKAVHHSADLAALMVTYPSTHGVFETSIREVCQIVHKHGGQVYLDGANLNAQLGLCYPGEYGPDVCHLNLHKTFCIPHGGGGPGMGPIAVKEHLAPYLPNHPELSSDREHGIGPVSAAPFGSAGILPISTMYIWMMGRHGLRKASEIAILNANYIARRLQEAFPILYRGQNGLVAHECIIDLRPLKAAAGIEVEDVAKRLIDYGFHAPTVSWPVPGTMMIEPTESEDMQELDRFCEAMIQIRAEVRKIESGEWDRDDNPVKQAPHTAAQATADIWPHSYSRERAVYPLPWIRERKYWPPVQRVDNAYGDRNLVCSCSW